MVGTTIAHYQILQQLGAGGMGVVYRAHDTKLGRDVALKVLPKEASTDPEAHQRLLEEARLASALNHPNICTIYEVNDHDGQTFAAMEYITGRPLRALIAPEGLPLELLIRYGAMIADAIAYAHEHQVIHRDIKSANVMVSAEGRVKVLDFGLAMRARSEAEQVTRGELSAARGSMVAGTLHYLAPEVLRGETADARSDIWALGVVLYEMASGRLPYDAASSYELTSAILRDPLPPLPGRVPAGLRAIIQRCLSREPGQRYQRAGEVRAALEAIGISDLSIPVNETVPTKTNRITRMIIGVGILLVLLWAGWFAANRANKSPREEPPASKSGAASGLTSTGARASKNPEANEYFEKGMALLTTQIEISRAVQMFERAVQVDPQFAEARGWFGFALFLQLDTGYSSDGALLYRAEEETRRALEIDPQNGHAHAALAALHFYRGRKDLFKEELDKALAINPTDFDARLWLGSTYYFMNGEFAEGKKILQQLLVEQPALAPAHCSLHIVLREAGEMQAALREGEKILEQDPRSPCVGEVARTFIYHGDLQKARRIMDGADTTLHKNFQYRLVSALLLAKEGKRAEARAEMDAETLKYAAEIPYLTISAAQFYATLGEPAAAADWLDRAVRNGDERLESFRRDPLLAPVLRHPRIQQVLSSLEFQLQQRKKKPA